MAKRLVFFFSFLFFFGWMLLPRPAQAIGPYVEPYLGFAQETFEQEGTASGYPIEGSGLNPVMGARLGIEFPYFFAGLDANVQTGSIEVDYSNGVSLEPDYDKTSVGAVAGLNFHGLPVRFWVGYDFLKEAAIDYDSGEQEFSGQGLKFGFGYRIAMMLFINFEYITETYDEYTLAGSTVELPLDVSGNVLQDELETQSAVVSLSLKF
jgi:hypothetical protein